MSVSVEFDHSIGLSLVSGGLNFHPNGKDYVYCAGGNVVIGNLTDPHEQYFLRKHDDFVTTVALSPMGNFIASGQQGENTNVYVWRYSTRELLFSLEEHDSMVKNVAFSHDERLLASLGDSEDKKLIIWDLSNGNIVAANSKIPLGTCCVSHGGFVKDIKRRDTQNYLLSTGGKEGIILWNLDPYSGDLIMEPMSTQSHSAPSRHITALAFFDNNDHLCAATTSGDYLIANMRSKKVIRTVPAARTGLGSILAYDGGVIVGGGDAMVKYFDHSQELRGQARLDGAIISMSFSPDKLEIIASTSTGTIVRLNLETMQFITLSESHTQSVVDVSFAPGQNDRFATASKDGTIRVWDASEYAVIATAVPKAGSLALTKPNCLIFTHVLLSGWTDGKVLAHDSDTGDPLWFIDSAHLDGVTAICQSHNGRFIVTGGQQGEVRLWELRSRELISNFKEHTQRITSVAIFEDDSQALSASKDKSILRWDLRSERRVQSQTQRMGGINKIALASDQQTILSVGQERRLTYWNTSSPNPLKMQQIDGENDEAHSVVISNNGRLVATGGTAGYLNVWDFQTGDMLSRVLAHSGVIYSVTFSPDDKQIVTVGEDGCISIWCVFSDEG